MYAHEVPLGILGCDDEAIGMIDTICVPLLDTFGR